MSKLWLLLIILTGDGGPLGSFDMASLFLLSFIVLLALLGAICYNKFFAGNQDIQTRE